MATVTLILVLLLTVAVSGLLIRFVKIPLPILQIILGVILALGGMNISMNPELFMLIFVPPLLFLDGHLAPKRELRELMYPILGLAFGLSLITTLVFGYALNWLIPAVPLPIAFALAAVLSPTDAVAVSAIVDKERVSARVFHALEGESLLNDATGLVIFRYAVAAALTGQFSLVDTAGSFVGAVTGGVFCGLFVFWGTAALLTYVARVGEVRPQVQVVLVMLVPFAAYLLAEYFHASGVLASVTAGLSFGVSSLLSLRHLPLNLPLSVPARMQNAALTELLSFIFNGAIFILLGLQLPEIIRRTPPELSLYGSRPEPFLAVLVLTIILLLIRYIWIDQTSNIRAWIAKRRGINRPRLSYVGKLVMAFAGVRGAITLAGILSLPLAMPDGTPFPARDLVIYIAAGVIICSMIIASLALPPLIGHMPLESSDVLANEERSARLAAAEAAIAKIEELAETATDSVEEAEARRSVAAQLVATYRQRIISMQAGALAARTVSPVMTEMQQAALVAERAVLVQLAARDEINDTTMREILSEITMQQALHGGRKNPLK
ncbi:MULTISPECIES: Na+/H+ antiporter [Mesorhizobium]|uniref:Na+/H+ antiporter n=1 Tax=Mesorhizobium denitrificans TaxID=2294114 RepID=A0A371X8M2_9HYPH|nr:MULTISPECIES: Na+/H+ antiporter [Mesorhizobium]RFC65589.1 Na+/H+ antiporter [Mesorhizobium denitrificans]